jgi:hypothetical protein
MSVRKSLAVCALFAGLFLTVFACGGDSDAPDDDDMQPAATTAPGVAGTLPAGIPQQVLTQIPPAALTAIPQVTVQTGGAGADACTLVTREEAAAALQVAVSAPNVVRVPPQPLTPGLTVEVISCEYATANGFPSITASIWRATGAGASQLRPLLEQSACVGSERVTGVGDLACWTESDRSGMIALRGTSVVQIDVLQGAPPPISSDNLRTIMMRALTRLQ